MITLGFLMLLSTPTMAAELSPAEIARRCAALPPERRQIYSLCRSTASSANSIAPKAPVEPKAVSPEGLAPEEIRRRCLQVKPDLRRRYTGCRAYWDEGQSTSAILPKQEPAKMEEPSSGDPFLGQEPKAVASTYSVYLGYSVLGGVKGVQGEVERRGQNFGFSVFYRQQTVQDFENAAADLTGSAYGIGVRYHLLPLWAYKRKPQMDVSLYLQVGLSSYTGPTPDPLPTYIYSAIGGDVTLPITKVKDSVVSGFVDFSIHHIYHSSTNFLHLGGAAALGLKIDF